MQFSFQYFSFYGCAVSMELYHQIPIDFAIDFAIFTMHLQTYGWTNGQNNGQMDTIMGGQTNEWMDV